MYKIPALAVTLLGAFSLSSCKWNQESSSTTEGAFRRDVLMSRTSLRACWQPSDQVAPELSSLIKSTTEKAIVEQFNQRTALQFSFSNCDQASNVEITLSISGKGSTDKCTEGGASGWTIFVAQDKREILFCTKSILNDWKDSIPGKKLRAGVAFVALHEFGHAVGLMHEYERQEMEDADPQCAKRLSDHYSNWREVHEKSRRGVETFGPYDPISVMNICSPLYRDTKGADESRMVLSDGDIQTLAMLYGKDPAVSPSQFPSQDPSAGPSPGPSAPPSPDAEVQPSPGPEFDPGSGSDSGSDSGSGSGSGSGPGPEPSPMPEIEPRSQPDTVQSVFVYCDTAKLHTCVVRYEGGSGCLNPNRSQRECTVEDAPSRVKLNHTKLSRCMVSRKTPKEKFQCLSSERQ